MSIDNPFFYDRLKKSKFWTDTFHTNTDIETAMQLENVWFEPAYDDLNRLLKYCIAVHCKPENKAALHEQFKALRK